MLSQPEEGEAAEDELEEDQRARKVVEVGWAYDEEEVRREMEDSRARTEKATNDWNLTETNSRKIRAKLGEQLDNDDMEAQSPKGSRAASPLGGFPMDATWQSSESAMYTQQNAMMLTDKMTRSRERFHTFAQRRHETLEGERRSRERVAAEIEAGHARGIARHHEVLEEQRRRAFASQQRRSEQQKALREFRRDEERQWEAYYAKQQDKLAELRANSPTPSMRSTGGVRPSSSSEVGSAMNEDIFRTTLQSHNEYASTMERWRQFVAENERRTEVYWRKMLQGKPDHLADGQRASRNASRRRTVKDGQLRPSGGRNSTRWGGANITVDGEDFGRSGASASFLSPSSSGTFGWTHSPHSPGSKTLASWNERRKGCIQLALDNNLRDHQRREQDHENLSQARSRIDKHNKDRIKAAVDASKVWQARNDTATQRRKELAVTTDEAYVLKLANFNERYTAEQKRLAAERGDQSSKKSKMISDVKAQSRALQANTVQKTLMKFDKIDDQMKEAERRQSEDRKEKITPSEKHKAMLAAAAERKLAVTKELFDRVRKEVAMKEKKTEVVMKVKAQPVLQRQRTVAKEKSRNKSGMLNVTGPMEPGSLVAAFSLPDLRNGGADEYEANILAKVPTPANQARRPSVGSHHSHDELQYKEEFHVELEGRSAKWLSEMRKNQKMMPAF